MSDQTAEEGCEKGAAAVRAQAESSGRGRLCGRRGRVIRQVLDYYAEADGTCAALLRLRYLEEWPEAETIEKLHIGRTTYYHKELETLSTAAVFAAKAGLI